MMLICAWPSAGPTGGAGVALPAAICNLTEPVAFFAIVFFSPTCPSPKQPLTLKLLRHLLHLVELQLHRGRTAENRYHHFQGLAIFVHLIHYAGEAGERTFGDAHRLVLLKLDLELGLLAAVGHLVNN